MRATEIMVGDRLAYKGQFAAFTFRVEQVTKHKVGYHAEPGESRMHYLRLHECSPIPLTDEILEKSGFEKRQHDRSRCVVFDPKNDHVTTIEYDHHNATVTVEELPFIDMNPDNNRCQEIRAFGCRYVHELQHLLRLFDIDKEVEL